MTAVALLALTVLAAWTLGGLLLRGLGTISVLAGLATATGGRPMGFAVALVGALAWVVGQHLYGVRHHVYRSPLARRLYTHTPLARIGATRGWTAPLQTAARRSPAAAPRRLAAPARPATRSTWSRRPDSRPTRRTRHDHAR